MLGPWPESLYCYAQTWSRLAEHAHLVAVDLPGFGHSERRDGLMSPSAMGGFIIRVADEFGLEHPHVVGPDVGTNAALFAAASQPGRLRSLVVGSGGAAVPIQLGGALKDWVEDPDFEHYRHADPRKIVAAALATIERYQIPPDIYEDYLSAYEGDRFFESMRYVRTYPEQLPVLRDLLPAIRPRCRTSPAATTGRSRPATPSSSTSGCRTASSTSSTRATSPGKTAPTSSPP